MRGSGEGGRECGIGEASPSSDVEMGLTGGGSKVLSVGFLLDSRVSRVDRLSFSKPLIASESSSMQIFRSSMPFGASLGEALVRVRVIGGEKRGECGASDSGDEVWTATEVRGGECFPLGLWGTSDIVRKAVGGGEGLTRSFSALTSCSKA
jgi:hypothetical protein